MKKTLVLLLISFAMTNYICAQKNAVKFGLSVGDVGIQYERLLSKHISVLGHVGIGYGYTGIASRGNHSKENGIAFMLEARYYFSSERRSMDGWYVAPSVKRVKSFRDFYYPYLYTRSDGSQYIAQSVETKNLSYNIYCLTTGRQWVFNSNLAFGFSVGIGYQKDLYKDNSFSATSGNYNYSSNPSYTSTSSSGSGTSLPIALQIGLSFGYAF